MKRYRRYRIDRSFDTDEIPLFLLFFYLFNEIGLDLYPTSGFKVFYGPIQVEDIVK